MDLSIIIPALNEGPNLELLLPSLSQVLADRVPAYEIIIVTALADEITTAAAQHSGARLLVQTRRGYGGALLAGLEAARGEYAITMDADLSHPPLFVRDLWAARSNADVTVASRYVAGGRAIMPRSRYVLSRILNSTFRRGLRLEIHDVSSGFRIYRTDTIRRIELRSRDFDILEEILVRSKVSGATLAEIPFSYEPRNHGSSHVRLIKFGLAYLRTFRSLRRLVRGQRG